jgi:hypothetical protein
LIYSFNPNLCMRVCVSYLFKSIEQSRIKNFKKAEVQTKNKC